jgi:hypothetical protein
MRNDSRGTPLFAEPMPPAYRLPILAVPRQVRPQSPDEEGNMAAKAAAR